MLYGHDEGKNIVQLCDGLNDVVCVGKGGTGKTNAADALEALGGISKKLLWQNASPASEFPAQTINFDLSAYDAVLIFAKANKTSNNIVSVEVLKGVGTFLSVSTSINAYRTFTVASHDITVSAGYQALAYNSTTTQNNDVVVPLEIYGIKGVQ